VRKTGVGHNAANGHVKSICVERASRQAFVFETG